MTCSEGEDGFFLVDCDCCCNNRRPGPSFKGVLDAADDKMFEGTWSPGRTIDVDVMLAD